MFLDIVLNVGRGDEGLNWLEVLAQILAGIAVLVAIAGAFVSAKQNRDAYNRQAVDVDRQLTNALRPIVTVRTSLPFWFGQDLRTVAAFFNGGPGPALHVTAALSLRRKDGLPLNDGSLEWEKVVSISFMSANAQSDITIDFPMSGATQDEVTYDVELTYEDVFGKVYDHEFEGD